MTIKTLLDMSLVHVNPVGQLLNRFAVTSE